MSDDPQSPVLPMTLEQITIELYRIDRRLGALEGGAPIENPKPYPAPEMGIITLPSGTKISIGSQGATVTLPGYATEKP